MKSLRRNRNYKRKSNRRRTKSNRRSTKRRIIKGGYACSVGLCQNPKCPSNKNGGEGNVLSPNSRNPNRRTSFPCYCDECGLEQKHNTNALSYDEDLLDD